MDVPYGSCHEDGGLVTFTCHEKFNQRWYIFSDETIRPECNKSLAVGFNPENNNGVILTELSYSHVTTRLQFMTVNPNINFFRVFPSYVDEKCQKACRIKGDKWTMADTRIRDNYGTAAKMWRITRNFSGYFQIQNYQTR